MRKFNSGENGERQNVVHDILLGKAIGSHGVVESVILSAAINPIVDNGILNVMDGRDRKKLDIMIVSYQVARQFKNIPQ